MLFSTKASLIMALCCAGVLSGGCGSAKEKAASTTSAVTSAVKTAVQGGGDFEGTVAMQMESAGMKQPMKMTYFIKGERNRVETDLPGTGMRGAMIMADGKMTTLMPQQKMYLTMDMKQAGDEMKQAARQHGGQDPEKFPKLTATGKTETIAGHSCEHYLMGDKQEIDLCVAKGLGYFGMGSRAGGEGVLKNLMLSPKLLAEAATHPEWVKLLEGGAFPLKIVVGENGQARMTMQATSIEPKKLDDSLFTVPADYKEMKMPAGFGQ